jgi:hypothetical protein
MVIALHHMGRRKCIGLKPWSNNLTETVVELSPTAHPRTLNQKLKNYLSTKVDGNTAQCFLVQYERLASA